MVIKQIKSNFRNVLSQGLTSCELATCLTIAVLATTFPVIGITTLVVTAIGIRMKLNIPLLILITYSLEPLRFFIFLPLTEVGSFLLNSPQELTLATVKHHFNAGFIETAMFFLHQFIFALTGWLLLIVPFTYPFYKFVKYSIGISVPKTQQCLRK